VGGVPVDPTYAGHAGQVQREAVVRVVAAVMAAEEEQASVDGVVAEGKAVARVGHLAGLGGRAPGGGARVQVELMERVGARVPRAVFAAEDVDDALRLL
jgi:hypothetical protein